MKKIAADNNYKEVLEKQAGLLEEFISVNTDKGAIRQSVKWFLEDIYKKIANNNKPTKTYQGEDTYRTLQQAPSQAPPPRRDFNYGHSSDLR